MSKDLMLKCLIAFILGWLLCRMMGNGFRVSASSTDLTLNDLNNKLDRIQTNLTFSINKSDSQIKNIKEQLESLHEALMKKGIKF